MPENSDPDLRELADPEVSRLPLGFQRVFVKDVLPLDVEKRLMVTNTKYHSNEGPRGTEKPISKIVSFERHRPRSSEDPEPPPGAVASKRLLDTGKDSERGSVRRTPAKERERFDPDLLGEHYLRLFSDCILVQGTAWSAIYDLTRGEIIRFRTEYYAVLKHLTRGKLADQLEPLSEPSQRAKVVEFVEYLLENELIHATRSPEAFPAIEEFWDAPGILQNAVIDVDQEMHDFAGVFAQLDDLGCRVVQIRGFSRLLGLSALERIVPLARHKSIECLELIIRHEADRSDHDYARFVSDHPMVVHLVVHSAPEDREVVSPFDCKVPDELSIKIRFTTQQIDSEQHCGVITLGTLSSPSPTTFFENRLYNGCLNRKIAIDAKGRIKNCPSMPVSFGKVRHTRLSDVVRQARFQQKWSVTKDEIDTCRGCELRYACSDCRAYVEDANNGYAKPLKCGYDPARGVWADWNPQAALPERK